MRERKMNCSFCGAAFQVGVACCPFCGSPTAYAAQRPGQAAPQYIPGAPQPPMQQSLNGLPAQAIGGHQQYQQISQSQNSTLVPVLPIIINKQCNHHHKDQERKICSRPYNNLARGKQLRQLMGIIQPRNYPASYLIISLPLRLNKQDYLAID